MGQNFNFLNVVQFLDALNENLFKYIVVYFLIYYQGEESTSHVMAITGAVFILPFILFSSLGGIIADRWSKARIIRTTRIIQIAFMLAALIFISSFFS
jgi:acyl-[acyl-carrier-protein]-phospholipid O-acyltransferase/long-chain-fatty-acid--[acyl-carrier-protein] ligase